MAYGRVTAAGGSSGGGVAESSRDTNAGPASSSSYLDSAKAGPSTTSANTGAISNTGNASKHAILHLQPSTRQTVVKTITTTTIHYAPIRLPRPASPALTGDYVVDRQAYPVQLAEDKLARQQRRSDARIGTSYAHASSSSSSNVGMIGSTADTCRKFEVEFGPTTSSSSFYTNSAKTAGQQTIKAIYVLDGDTEQQYRDSDPSKAKTEQPTTVDIASRQSSRQSVDRKGKGKAREEGAPPHHLLSSQQDLPTESKDASLSPQLPLVDHKRKRLSSAAVASTAARSRNEIDDQIEEGERAAVEVEVEDVLSTSLTGKSSPRKRRKLSTAGATGTGATSSGHVFTTATTTARSPQPRTTRSKALAAAETVLPSPTLSPRLNAEEEEELEKEDEVEDEEELLEDDGDEWRIEEGRIDILSGPLDSRRILEEGEERRIVPYSPKEQSLELEDLRALHEPVESKIITNVEQVAEEEEDSNAKGSDEQHQLACLAEGYTLSALMSLPSLVSEFANLSEKLQASVLYQLLRQAPTPVIQKINHIIQPALKRDFISDLPPELALLVLSYLDSSTIMRCLLVSRNWKRFIDSQGQIWSDLLKADNLWVGGEPDQSAAFVENQEAEYWASVGDKQRQNSGAASASAAAASSTRRSRAARKRRSMGAPLAESEESQDANVGSAGSQNKETGREDEETTRELSVADLLAVSDWKAALFMKRWKEHTWDESFDIDEAARPTAEKLAALLHEASPSVSARNVATPPPASSSKPPAKLRRSNTRPRIGQYAPRIGAVKSTSPPSTVQALPARVDYVHPYKLIYKKRRAVRSHWCNPEDPATSVHRTTFRGLQTSVITNLQFDNEKIVTASDDPTIDVYSTMTGELLKRLDGHEGGVWALQYVGNVLVSGSTDRTVRVWDLETGNCTHVFYGHTSTVRCLQIVEPVNVNPDPNGPPVWEPPYPLIVTGSRDWTLRVWRLPYPTRSSTMMPYVPPSPSDEAHDPANNAYHLRVLRGHGLAVRALAAHGRIVVSGSYDSYLRVWDLLTGECKHKLVGHTAKVYSVALDTARNRCASGSMDGSVRIWSIETGEPLFRLDGHSSLVGLLGCSYHFLVSAGADSTLKVWDPSSGTCIQTLAANAGAITCFKHDDFRIVSGCEGQLRVWDIRQGQVVKDVVENMQGVWQLQFSDRFCVAAVSRDGAVDFEILDFFPELRHKANHRYDPESPSDLWDSADDDGQAVFEDYNAGVAYEDEDGFDILSMPPNEFSAGQGQQFQTPRQAGNVTTSNPSTHAHADGHGAMWGAGPLHKVHHHHHRHRHHHHHHSASAVPAAGTSGSRSTLRHGHSRNISANATSAASFSAVADPENIENLFAYDASNLSVETLAAQAGPSGTITASASDNFLSRTSCPQSGEMSTDKGSTPEVKQEMESEEF